MQVTLDLSSPVLRTCDLCGARDRCFLLADDQRVQKRFCVRCITRLLWACQPETPQAAKPARIPAGCHPVIREDGCACVGHPYAAADLFGGVAVDSPVCAGGVA
jgi:hypothetical protein